MRQDQFWLKWRSAAGCLEGWRSSARTLPLEWRTRPHPRGMVRNRPPTGAKLVGSTGQGRNASGCLASKAFVLEGSGGSMHRVHLPLILYQLSLLPLPKVHWLALIKSLSKLLWRGRKPMFCRQVCCHRPRNWSLGMPALESHWLAKKTGLSGPILIEGHGVGIKGERCLSSPGIRHKAEGRRKPKGA